MSGGEETVRLRHMLDHAREAVSLVKGKMRDDLDSDRLLNLALVRLVEIVGEAADSLSPREMVPVPRDSLAADCKSSQPAHSRL